MEPSDREGGKEIGYLESLVDIFKGLDYLDPCGSSNFLVNFMPIFKCPILLINHIENYEGLPSIRERRKD